MPLQTEIHSRERSLAELMTRILQAPLEPIERSVGKIGSDLLDTADRVRALEAAVLAALDQVTEDVAKSGRQSRSLASQFDKEIPAFHDKLAAHVTTTAHSERQGIESSMAAHADWGAALMHAVSEHLASGFSEMASGHSATLASMASSNLALTAALDAIHVVQRDAMEALRQDTQDIRAAQATGARDRASLAHQFETADKAAATRIDMSISAQQHASRQVTDAFVLQQAATGKLLATQHAALQSQITDCQRRLRQQAVSNGVSLLALFGLIGFEIVRRLN